MLKMSTNLIFIVLAAFILVNVESERPIREYLIKKDMITGKKAGQFSIYKNENENDLCFRIESLYSPMQKIDLLTYPDEETIGELDAHQLGSWYEARLKLLDIHGKWLIGHIRRKATWLTGKYMISMERKTITMKSKFFSREFKFYNQANKLLGLFKRQFFVISGATKYNLQIFSNEFPDAIYMLAIAAYDHNRTKTGTKSH